MWLNVLNDINETKNSFCSIFEMKDLAEIDLILGVKVKRIDSGFTLCQSHCIEKMLKFFDCLDVYLLRSPYDRTI